MTKKKITLNRETLRSLSQKDASEVGAGMAAPSGQPLFCDPISIDTGSPTDTRRLNTCCSWPYCSKW